MKKQDEISKLEEISKSTDLRRSKPIKLNYINFSNKDKVSIILKGDEHYGSNYFDRDFHKQWMDWIEENDCYVIGMGDNLECMDLETEILTEDGWKNFFEIGDLKVMTFNKKDGGFELQKPIKKVLHKYKGSMFHFHSNNKLDMLVTPNHRILCRYQKGMLKVKLANEFSKKSAKARSWNIPSVGNWRKKEFKIEDDWIRLFGWIISEGWNDVRGNSFRYYTSQSKKANPKYYEEIKKILKKLKINYKERHIKDYDSYSFRLSAKTPFLKEFIGKNTKSISRKILKGFSKRQLNILFETLLKGDGGQRGEFFTNSEILKNDFLELCLKIGKVTSVSESPYCVGSIRKKIFIIYTGKGKGCKGKSMGHKTITSLNLVEFDDNVWCVSVPNSFLVVKRNDAVFITGNTAVRDSIGAGIYEQEMFLHQQLEEFVEMNKKISKQGKLLGLHRGNHEERVYRHSGLDLTKIMSSMLNVKNFGVGTLHYLRVGKENYTLYTTHGHSGSRLPHTKIKACIDLSNMIEADIFAMGHVHQLSHHVRQFYKPNKKNKTLDEVSKHFILTGSYLTHWGSYAHEASYEMMRKGSPRLKLHGDKHLIKVSLG